jgi:hypothetical protein
MITVFSLHFDVEYIAFVIADCSALYIEFCGSCLLFIVLSGNTTAYPTLFSFFDPSVYALTCGLYFSSNNLVVFAWYLRLLGIFDCLILAGLWRVQNQICFGLFLSMVVCNNVVKVSICRNISLFV